jgi:hypothetical protein
MPVAEHAFYPSWGYQVTGLLRAHEPLRHAGRFSISGQRAAQAGIGVIIDWVPAHFPRDEWALANFDGTALYEHEDPRQRRASGLGHADFQFWPPRSAQFSRLANALFWCERFILTACAWMPWPRCFTWIIRANPANGCRINSAGGKIWKQLNFSKSSTIPCTRNIRAW